MRFVIFPHSLASDWCHGNAHFLRGCIRELLRLGHDVKVYELKDNWSAWNYVEDQGPGSLDVYHDAYPEQHGELYTMDALDLEPMLTGADVVIVHEFNQHELVAKIGEHHKRQAASGGYRLFFHDTHHRVASQTMEMAKYDLSGYDGVLAFGDILRQLYLLYGWARRAWTWHEAADATIFRPMPEITKKTHDLVWVGNWGDDERTDELQEFLLRPVKKLGLRAIVYGVRYPEKALCALKEHGIEYGGYLPNHKAPEAFARARVTVHVPRRPYSKVLPGIPTIRPFEALASGIPLVSAPWQDREGLFTVGEDFLMVKDGREMTGALADILGDPAYAETLAAHGRATVLRKHTCAHRVAQLFEILGTLDQEMTLTTGTRASARVPSSAPALTPVIVQKEPVHA